MEELIDFLKILGGFLVVAACLWAYLKLLAFLDAHRLRLGRYDARQEPSKVEIQTLFHGNTKDEDQI
jgi:hypothetical protein